LPILIAFRILIQFIIKRGQLDVKKIFNIGRIYGLLEIWIIEKIIIPKYTLKQFKI
jgi:hypothetical protein